MVRPGETAALLAQRLTGNAQSRHQVWFQILNPATATYIPKSLYGDIQSGWYGCVAPEKLRPASSRTSVLLVAPPAPVLQQAGSTGQRSTIDLSVLLWAAPLFAVSVVWLTWIATRKHFGRRRASLDTMRGYGDRFIAEFKRPLFRRTASDVAVRSRLRFSPSRHKLEVLLAPADGRTYPNLVDHRKNVEYDVERVERILRDEPFVSGPLHAEGSWVVIPFNFERDRQQEGVS